VRKNKQLLLGSSLGALVLLITAAYQENFRQEWRDIQRGARTEEGPVPLQLRQVVNPALGISDRCVSCHVSMAPGEQNVTGLPVLSAHKPVVHDPAEFGCTVCHGGQGLATRKEDAHGNVEFWPQPMVPLSMSEAGCGSCHVPLAVPNRKQFEQAQAAFERLDCLACHRVDFRGGTVRPGGGGMEGPDLSRVGIAGYDEAWYVRHLKKSAEAGQGAWKDSFGTITPSDQNLLQVYLASRIAAPVLVEAKSVFHSSGCLGCHKVSGAGGDAGPDLTRAGEKDPGRVSLDHLPGGPSLANWFAEHFRSPGALVADSQMPMLGLTENEIRLLTLYTLSLRRRDIPGTYLPLDRVRATRLSEREFATDGATLFGAFCSGCHGPEGQGRRSPGLPAFPAIANPDFLSIAPEALIRETIRQGRPGRRMPAWDKPGGLTPEETGRIVDYLRTFGSAAPAPDARPARWLAGDKGEGKRLFEAACSGCHGINGEGGEGPALNNSVLLANATDTYLVETISRGRRGTFMPAFSEASPVHPTFAAREIESLATYIRSWEVPAGGQQ
jgi:cbb3-type cytochrome c oxidase subunit III